MNDGQVATWGVWDLNTDSFVPNATVAQTHPAALRSAFLALDPNLDTGPQWRYDPATGTMTNVLFGQAQLSVAAQHRGDQWVMADAELPGGALGKQWMLFDSQDDGHRGTGAAGFTWAPEGGEIYSTAADVGWYDFSLVGVRSVRQFVEGDATRVARQLAAVATRGALVEGSFFFDALGGRVYAWAQGGGDPAGRLLPLVPGAIHDALGFYRADGSEVRFLAHHYSVGEPDYWQTPRATISADGKLAMFDSNMNHLTGRGDVFVAEVPVR
jgi:hypothetical protein